MHMENDYSSLKTVFASILDSVGVLQNVPGPTYSCLKFIHKHTISVAHDLFLL